MVFEKCDDETCVGCAMGEAVHFCRAQEMPPELLIDMFFDWMREAYADQGHFEHTLTKQEEQLH